MATAARLEEVEKIASPDNNKEAAPRRQSLEESIGDRSGRCRRCLELWATGCMPGILSPPMMRKSTAILRNSARASPEP